MKQSCALCNAFPLATNKQQEGHPVNVAKPEESVELSQENGSESFFPHLAFQLFGQDFPLRTDRMLADQKYCENFTAFLSF